MTRHRQQAQPPRMRSGFTLVEVLVALTVLSIAVVALLKVQGESARSVTYLEEKAIAQVVAENVLVGTLARPGVLQPGTARGQTEMAGRSWTWQRQVTLADQRAQILRIDVAAGLEDSDQVLSEITAFRSAR